MDTNGYPKALAVQVTRSGAAWATRQIAICSDWAVAKARFLEHFDHPEQQFVLRQRLFQIKQGGQESVRQYYDRFGELVANLNEDDSNPQVLLLFYNGLKDSLKPFYRMTTLSTPPTNFAKAVVMAQALEMAQDPRSAESAALTAGKGSSKEG